MSIATKQLQQAFHSSTRQQQRARTFPRSQQQLNVKKSIVSTGESVVKHVSNKAIKPKQLIKQKTTVAVTETEEKSEYKKNKPQSQDIEKIIVNELEDNYLNEQELEDDTYLNEQDNSGVIKDYKIYQNGKVNEFFQNERLDQPKRVADICLVNDNYILIKMPDQETTTANHNNIAEAAAARRKEFKELKQQNDKILKDNEKENKKLYRYLRIKRNRITKIAPIHEEPEEDISDNEKKSPSKSYCLKMQSCWQANREEVECYQTQTKIHKNITNFNCDPQKTEQVSTSLKLKTEKSSCIDIPKAQDVQTISGSLRKSSLQYQVSLHNYGSLIESPSNKNSNNTGEMIKSPRRKICPHLESFYWLWRPFRSKYRKSKPKIQAVVYKTYFVKWTKPPDTLTHGYGVKSLKSSHIEMSVLRRCRSATF